MNLFYEETFTNDFIYKSISTFLYVVWDSLASNFFQNWTYLKFSANSDIQIKTPNWNLDTLSFSKKKLDTLALLQTQKGFPFRFTYFVNK